MPPPPAPGLSAPSAPRFLRWMLPSALLLFFLRFGYDYGTSDQDEVIPFLLHRLNPDLFTQDWFVTAQAEAFGIRSYFVTTLQSLALLLPVWLAVLLCYVVCWLLLAAAVYGLGYRLTRDRVAAAASVVAALVLTPQWTLGGNDLAHAMLVPSMAGWCLGLWGLLFWLQRRPQWAGLLTGLATWMQALVGLQLGGLLGLVSLLRMLRRGRRDSVRPFLLFCATYLLAALPALGPLVYQQLTASAAAETAATPSLFYIMAAFRNPHHYLFFSFPAGSMIRFGLLAALGGAGFVLLHRKRRLQHAGFLGLVFIVIAACCLLAFVFTEVTPSLFIAKLQLFKLTVLAKLLLVILLCGAVCAALPGRLKRLLHRATTFHRTGLACALAAWIAVLAGVGLDVGFLNARARPLARRGSPLALVETWARTRTPPDAVFAVPPSWSGFRSHAERAIVVDFKAFPYNDRLIYTWFERLTQMAPITLPERAGPALQDSLDAAFLRQPAPVLHRLAGRYGFDYVVREGPPVPLHPAFEQVFASGNWIVYRIDREGE